MNMGERIKEKRKELGLTQEELGKRVGLQKSAIAKYENGRVENMKRSMIEKMSEVLGCSPTWLIGVDQIDQHLSRQIHRIIEYVKRLSPNDQTLIERIAHSMILESQKKSEDTK